MIYTIIREIISLTAVNQQVAGRAALAMLIILKFIILLIFPVLVHVVIYHYFIEKKARKKRITRFHALLVFVQVIGILLFTYGDDISNITLTYGEVLGCDSRCIENNKIAAAITIGLSLFIFHILPHSFQNVAKQYEELSDIGQKSKEKSLNASEADANKITELSADTNKKTLSDYKSLETNKKTLSGYRLLEETRWFYALEMLITIIKIDTLYTAVAITTQTDGFCSSIDEGLSIGFFIISWLLGAFHMIANGKYSHTLDLKGKYRTIHNIGVLVLAVVCLLLYLLADNHQPLDCFFECDTFATDLTTNRLSFNSTLGCYTTSNTTPNNQACNRIGNSITRLLFMITVLLLILIVLVEFIISICRAKKKSNKVSPFNKDL